MDAPKKTPYHFVISLFADLIEPAAAWDANTWPFWKPFLQAAFSSVGNPSHIFIHDRQNSEDLSQHTLIIQGFMGFIAVRHQDGNIAAIYYFPCRPYSLPFFDAEDEGYPFPVHIILPHPMYILHRTSVNHFRRLGYDPWWSMPLPLSFPLPNCSCWTGDIAALDTKGVDPSMTLETIWPNQTRLHRLLFRDARMLYDALQLAIVRDRDEDAVRRQARIKKPLFTRTRGYVYLDEHPDTPSPPPPPTPPTPRGRRRRRENK